MRVLYCVMLVVAFFPPSGLQAAGPAVNRVEDTRSADASMLTNSLFPVVEVTPIRASVASDRDAGIIVYTDDCHHGFNHVLTALDELGLSYDLFHSDYLGFEAAVGDTQYNVIIINHDCFHELSYAWGEVYSELAAGKACVISSYDWDGSNDYSGGYIDSLLELNDLRERDDLSIPVPVFSWNQDPIFTGTDGLLDVYSEGYMDDGDTWDWSSSTAEGGLTPQPAFGKALVNVTYNRVYFGFLPDEMKAEEMIQIWKNAINMVLALPASVESQSELQPHLYLGASVPNPFSRLTDITYELPGSRTTGPVSLAVFSPAGRLVQTLVDSPQPPGIHTVIWNGNDRFGNPVTSGVYFFRLLWNGESLTRRTVLIR